MHADAGQLPAAWHAAHAALVAAGHPAVSRVLAANVAGAALRDRLTHMLATGAALRVAPDAIEWFASVAERAGVKNGYRNPAQLGCDRFAAAIGAHALVPGQAVIVANCGTATTIDAVTADGRFLGGMILPGLGLMATSLARNTAQLPQIAQGGKLPSGFADNTDDAILSGLLAAQAGAIERVRAAPGPGLPDFRRGGGVYCPGPAGTPPAPPGGQYRADRLAGCRRQRAALTDLQEHPC
jgi:type III pantothenate kinase